MVKPGTLEGNAKPLKHYTAQQLGTFQEGGSTAPAKTPKKSAEDDAVKYFKTIKKAPSAPIRSGWESTRD